jgi:hypothetical protein
MVTGRAAAIVGIVGALVAAFVGLSIFRSGEAYLPLSVMWNPHLRGAPAYVLGGAWVATAVAIACVAMTRLTVRWKEHLRKARDIAIVSAAAMYLGAVVVVVLGENGNVAL